MSGRESITKIIVLSSIVLIFLMMNFGCCLKFTDLESGTEYNVGDTITTSGKDIIVNKFQYASGVWTTSGSARVDSRNYAQGSGYDLNARNVNLNFKFDYPLSEITLKFGELGGNNNIEINGEFKNIRDLIELNGTSLGGVQIIVNATQPEHNWYGMIILSGTINDFSIGGQELWLDDVCTKKQ